MLVYAIVSISLALVFYTVGVWSEKLQGTLKKWHLCLFWIGFVFDTLGTTLMGQLANDVLKLNFHSVTGVAAIVLMLIHAVWATIVLTKNDQKQKINFPAEVSSKVPHQVLRYLRWPQRQTFSPTAFRQELPGLWMPPSLKST